MASNVRSRSRRPADAAFPASGRAPSAPRARLGLQTLERRDAPANFIVSNTNDAGTGSLRQAISDANNLTGADSVTFDPGVFGTPQTITLTTGEMAIADPVTIIGPAAKLTVDANKSGRHFSVDVPGSSLESVAIANLTLTNGQVAGGSGGAIFVNDEAVVLTNVTLTANSAPSGGAIGMPNFQTASLDITDCVLTGNSAATGSGGAILASAKFGMTSFAVSITGTTISGNTAKAGGGGIWASVSTTSNMRLRTCTVTDNTAGGKGGGVYASAALAVENCTLSGNTGAGGGGLWAQTSLAAIEVFGSTVAGNQSKGDGGGIQFGAGNQFLIVTNSTVSGNTAAGSGGGIHFGTGQLSLQSVTMTGNTAQGGGGGGGMTRTVGDKTASLSSTIVSGNVDKSGSAHPDFYVTVQAVNAGNCAIGSAAGVTTLVETGGNLFGQALKLGPLADNGGPTHTHRPLPGSPVINAGGSPGGLSFDQRGPGFPRVSGGAADIGSVETSYPPTVRGVLINDGAAQRSRVMSLTVGFDSVVNFPADPAAAFELVRQGDAAVVGLAASVTHGATTKVTLTFPGAVSEFGSLADGRYTLTVAASQVANANGMLDGDVNGTGGDNFILASAGTPDPPTNIFRYFGDADGDGDTDMADFMAFRDAVGLRTGEAEFNPALDADGDGDVDARDLLPFRDRFGTSI